MNALIDPNTSVQRIIAWEWKNNQFNAVFEVYPNSGRVCEVCAEPFPVAQPLFWVTCEENVVADQFYCDLQTQAVHVIEVAPIPNPPDTSIPVTEA